MARKPWWWPWFGRDLPQSSTRRIEYLRAQKRHYTMLWISSPTGTGCNRTRRQSWEGSEISRMWWVERGVNLLNKYAYHDRTFWSPFWSGLISIVERRRSDLAHDHRRLLLLDRLRSNHTAKFPSQSETRKIQISPLIPDSDDQIQPLNLPILKLRSKTFSGSTFNRLAKPQSNNVDRTLGE
jgi:hypothetical protein